ncbi:acyl-CoA dehydrogenase family protein [Ramlibacter sp.]|uniref:acyl-CoA dehydrogenase family protein n=1 Tax=Ramlibacter sp. TaxID=1917967 RepID=UPI003D0B9A12
MSRLEFAQPRRSAAGERIRREVREFLDAWPTPWRVNAGIFGAFDAKFSEALGARGWIGMGFPREYGGSGFGLVERYVVLEELLAARAPIFAHAIADRQSGPTILRYGTEEQRRRVLPGIAAGTCYIAIGMSEPNAGSDLASVRTGATRVDGGWRINGSKIWTSNAHRSHFMIMLCRTGERGELRHAGLSQFLVDLKTPGITCRPIANIAGESDFNEVHLDDVFVSDADLVGNEGEGWKQVTSELALERSGPERFLSHMAAVERFVDALKRSPSEAGAVALGRIVAHLSTLRRMSRSIATMIADGHEPALHAAMVKDLGTVFEQEIPEIVRLAMHTEPNLADADPYAAALADVILNAPSSTLRGGTKEVLRGIVAKSLGLR